MADKTFSEFEETVTLEIPRIDDKLIQFSEARGGGSRGLIIEVAAIHAGLTANYNHYAANELEKSVQSWVTPYPKPIIMNHDLTTDAVGRVMAAKMDAESDGTPFTRLQIAVTDPSAIEKVMDQRYLTGSVGGKSTQALCSVCHKDWAEAAAFGPLPCKHARGKVYNGQLAFLNRSDLSFKEYSFVNSPADSRSQVLPPSADGGAQEGNEWVTPARFYDLNMDKEEIVEYTESENRNVLSGMKKRQSSPIYLSLKGAFLSSLAESEKHAFDDEENSTVDENDVLAVTEELSGDLAGSDETVEEAQEEVAVATDAEETTETETEEDATDAVQSSEDGSTVESLPDDSEADAEGDTSSERDEADDKIDEETQEGEVDTEAAEALKELERLAEEANKAVEEAKATSKSPAQEKAHTADVDSQFNHPEIPSPRPSAERGANRTRESEEEVDEAEATEVTERDSKAAKKAKKLERRVKNLIAREEQLSEENARLKKALHRMLAERVVDTKIALGLEKAMDRSGLLEEYLQRSASSLADSVRDLATSQKAIDYSDAPTMEQRSASINDDGSDIEGATSEAAPAKEPEDVLVDVLMGRRPL